MSGAHGNMSAKLRKAGSDPNVDDTEGTPGPDTWSGRGARGWVDLLRRTWGGRHRER